MPLDERGAKEKLKPSNIGKLIKHKAQFRKEHPDYFDADGMIAFVGSQGQGKTLSAVNYTYNLMQMYPQAKLVTNIMLRDYPIVTFEEYKQKQTVKEYSDRISQLNLGQETHDHVMYQYYLTENRVFPFNDNEDFQRYSNGERGVIFFVDEIQLYMNSLESKNLNIEVITQISQQRKQRKHIVCTSQVFGRMAKPLREQFSNVIQCKCIFGILQSNALISRDDLQNDTSTDTNVTAHSSKKFVWFHHPDMYKRYDTYYVIEKGKFVGGEQRKGEIYGTGNQLPSNN